MVPQFLSSALIVCTLDRPAELRRCLLSCLRSSLVPNKIVVCDASPGDQSKELVNQLADQTKFHLSWLRGPIGLTKQRNCAINSFEKLPEIIHFVDDDVELDKHYFEALNGTFSSSPEIIGCGGIVMNIDRLPEPAEDSRQHRRRGLVTKMGVNHIMKISRTEEFGSPKILDVDWLSGCCMSFRAELFESIHFDERRQGSGIGEDVDFSLRAKAHGRLAINTAARVDHLQSPKSRPNRNNLGVQNATHRLRLSADGLIGGSPNRVAIRCIWDGLANVAGGWRDRDSGKRKFGRGILVGVRRWYRRGGRDV